MKLIKANSRVKLLVGDCREVLGDFPDNHFDSVVTDPPYELKFMNRKWDGSGIAYSIPMWQEVLRVLKPGGHLLSFGGTRTYHRMTVAIEDAGFEIRDCLQWIYGSGFPKSLDISKALDGVIGKQGTGFVAAGHDGRKAEMKQDHSKRSDYGYRYTPSTEDAKQWRGWGTALKPAYEPIVLARKPLEGTVAKNVLEYGTGGLNIDATRIKTDGPSPAAKRRESARRTGNAPIQNRTLGVDTAAEAEYMGRIGRRGSVDVYMQERASEQLGRWPANVILDEEAGKLLDEQADASRFFYCAKASRSEREAGLDHLPVRSAGEVTGGRKEGSDGLNSPRAGAGRSSGARNYHPTVKPISLMRYLVKLVTPTNGLTLDPFVGSGTTGCAAVLEGFRFVGVDLEADHIELAQARIDYWRKKCL